MRIRTLIVTAALAVVPVTAALAVPGTANAGAPICRDSNGSRPGGSVYVADGVALRCDVVPPQRLHVTRVSSRAACDDMGGHGWSRKSRICWDVDF